MSISDLINCFLVEKVLPVLPYVEDDFLTPNSSTDTINNLKKFE